MPNLAPLPSSSEAVAVPEDLKKRIRGSADQVAHWVEQHNYQAYDPGDGDLSFLRYCTFNTHFLRRLLTAAVLRTPFHIRPCIGVRPHTSTKGMGYMAWGHVKMYALTREESFRWRAEFCFDWLTQHKSPGSPHFSWGNHFTFSTRSATIPRYTPTIVWSSLIGLSFLEGYEVLGDPRYLEVASSVCEWIKGLPRQETSRGTCLSYVPFTQLSIHNSNMLGAALLARVAAYTRDQGALDLAKAALLYSCSRQNEDGGWYYGEETKYHWIDNFHTGYNLDCLKRYIDSTGDHQLNLPLRRGFEYFRRHFFEADGRPKYYDNKTCPIDIQCAAQAIDTLTFFSEMYPDSLALALQVAQWTIAHMQAPDGHFYYRDLGWKKVKTPMFHWGQGTMFKALAHLLSKVG